MKFCYEIYLADKFVQSESWQKLIDALLEFQKPFSSWKIIILCQKIKVHYYLETNFKMPVNLGGLPNFLFQTTKAPSFKTSAAKLFYINQPYSFIDLRAYLAVHKKFTAKVFEFRFYKTLTHSPITKIYTHGQQKSYRLLPPIASELLAADFAHNPDFAYKSPPKYLDTYKALPLLSRDSVAAFLEVDAFPYHQVPHYLNQSIIDFNRHSLVLGASGSGKSKFLSLLIDNVANNPDLQKQYKFIVIDPHAALENEIGQLGRVIDFLDVQDNANLFSSHTENATVAVELLLDIFKGLIANNYNPKLERVLRHSLYLLLDTKKFDFRNLRELLLDLDFRNQILQTARASLPASVTTFFHTEFSEIKTRSYTEAISPIIALIDEVEMIPVFNQESQAGNIAEIAQENFLTIFSLDRTKFGDRVVKTIAGLIMQQVLTLAEQHTFLEHVILIVDEVAVIENPILCRFLAEARKYHLSVILAGQYFGGVSETLRRAIFANVINYYIFRIAKDDANLIVHNFDMKIPIDNTFERKVKTLTDLQDRECIVRTSAKGKLIPAFKCKTMDFTPKPRIRKPAEKPAAQTSETSLENIEYPLDMASTKISLRKVLSFCSDTKKSTGETSMEFIKHESNKPSLKLNYQKVKPKQERISENG